MNQEQKTSIIEYLKGPRVYAEGVALYRRFGNNRMLMRQFELDETSTTREMLTDALRRLAGLSEAEFYRLPRLAKPIMPDPVLTHAPGASKAIQVPQDDESRLMELATSFDVTVDELVSPEFQERVLAMDDNEATIDDLTKQLEEARSKYEVVPEPVRRMIRFREKYPFLNAPDCPDELKILVADMFTAYGNYKTAFARLQVLDDAETVEAAAECETIVTEYLKNREIWDELEYYREHGVILGKAAKFREMEAADDLAALSDVDLMGKLRSAAANVSKQKKRVADAEAGGVSDEKAMEALTNWQTRKAALEAEVDRRKKK